MINSPRSILNRKQFNTQSSITPNKKIVNSSVHYSNQKSISYQNSGSSVSYAQLQIILQNVHKIKKKASQQIHSLQTKSSKQEEELKILRQQVKRYENFEQTIKQQKQTVQLKYQAKISVLNQQIQSRSQQLKKTNKKLSQVQQQLEYKQQEIGQLNERLQNCDKQSQFWQHKYHELTNILQINETSHQIKVIKEQYTNIPHLLAYLSSTINNLQHQSNIVEELKRNAQATKEQLSQNNKIINTVTDQNRHLLSIIQGLTKQKQTLTADLASTEHEKTQMLRQRDLTINGIQQEIQIIKNINGEQLSQKQNIIDCLKSQIKSLENKLIEAADKQRINKQQSQFKSIVDEVCDQYADYENVMKRIQYLQKYRSQYYFNIQKIQYLCRILDS